MGRHRGIKSGIAANTAILTAALLFLGAGGLPARAQPLSASVTVDPAAVAGTFSPLLLGHNIQWTDAGDGMLEPRPKPGGDVFRPQALAAVEQVPVPLLRFPGGKLASTYRWRDGVGDRAGRKPGRDFSGAFQSMLFGTDEYLTLLRRLKARGMITLNMTRGPDESLAWMGHVSGAGGGVVWWEAGNESFLPQDPSFMTAADYVKKFAALRASVRQRFPQAKLGALLEGSLLGAAWGPSVVPELASWNDRVIAGTAGTADFYATHLYGPLARGSDAAATARVMAAAVQALEQNLRRLQALIKKHRSRAGLFVTECNVLTDDAVANWRYGTSLSQAGFTASMLLACARCGVNGACYWSLIGNHNFGMVKSADEPRLRPSGEVYRLFAPLAGAAVLATQVEAPLLPYTPAGNVPAGLAVPALDALGFVVGAATALMLVNRDPLRPMRVSVKLSGASAPPGGLALDVISGRSHMTGNEHAALVAPRAGKAAVALGAVTFTLPAAAVARLTIEDGPARRKESR